MKQLIFILISLMLAACSKEECIGPFPDYKYFNGEKATYIPTTETVRIIGDNFTVLVGFTECEKKKYGQYTIRFKDGGEIRVSWENLSPIEAWGQ